MHEFGAKSRTLPSPEKNEFVIGRDAISRCLEGLTCTLQALLSRYSVTFSIPPHPTLFLCKFGRITGPTFSKSGGTHPTPAVAPAVHVECL